MVVDVHAHIIVPEITLDAAPTETWRPRVRRLGDEQVIEIGGRMVTTVPREFVQIEAILEAQAAAGIDHLLLCPWVSLLRYDAAAEECLRSSRIINDALVRLSEGNPARITALGTVPLQDPDLAAWELVDLMRRPGMRGVEVQPNVGDAYLGDDRFRPFWEAADATGAIIFIHPSQRGFNLPVLKDYYLWNTVGNPMETTIVAAHLVVTGVMETYSRCKVMLAHGGGAILALRGRLRHAHRVKAQARAHLRESVDDSLRRFYFDTITHDPDLLRALIEYAGTDRVLLGSDYPFDMRDDRPVDSVRALGLRPDIESDILGGNAVRLLGLRA